MAPIMHKPDRIFSGSVTVLPTECGLSVVEMLGSAGQYVGTEIHLSPVT